MPVFAILMSNRNFPADLETDYAVLSVRTHPHREDFGLRWQSAATAPLFECGTRCRSGVALRFPPHSKKFWLRLRRAVNHRLYLGQKYERKKTGGPGRPPV